jgi:DNA-binding transcriptional regulator YiaG
MKCKCGAVMKRVTLDEYDFSGLAGLPVVVKGMPALRCPACREEMLAGQDIERVLNTLTLEVLKRKGRLAAKEARFLRHRLQFTQKELAERMGLHTVTVAAWESKKAISPQHDHILRAMVLVKLAPAATPQQLRAVLEQVHKANPPKTVQRFVVSDLAS